jgi:class 3 adenylate cyclase
VRSRLTVRATAQEFRIVTVIFCDVVKSTELERELDPLPMQRLLDRYGTAVRRALGDGGASVGKRHGDGFMAAFGVPELHEDDALRAVRAAGELRTALDELAKEVREQRGLEFHVRLGINTGNVLVRDAGTLEEELTGTPVNLAKRFEELAGAGEVLLGEETYRLVADAVKAEPAGPLMGKGAAEPQNVWRLLEVLPDRPGRARRPVAPMVGRGREQQLLQQLFERAAAEGACHLVSVLGSAGVGKSRLVDEFVAGLGDQASVLRGHCPAFGDSVTMWPMVEVVRQAAGIAPDDSPEQARARLTELLAGVERGNLVTERVAQLLGFGQDAGLPEDTFWALGRLLETLARRRPLVLVIDDLQWAHPILLDAVEHVAEYADAPLMLPCMARPDELFSRRAQWPGGKANTLSFLLSPCPSGRASSWSSTCSAAVSTRPSRPTSASGPRASPCWSRSWSATSGTTAGSGRPTAAGCSRPSLRRRPTGGPRRCRPPSTPCCWPAWTGSGPAGWSRAPGRARWSRSPAAGGAW